MTGKSVSSIATESEEGKMKKYLVAAVLAVTVAAIASVAFGSTKSPARTSFAGSALVSCGTTRTIGVAAPITGPASSIGQQQLRWAQFYVKRWNAQKANKKKKIKIVQGDTQLGVDTAFAVKVAQSFASNSKLLGVVGPAGSQEVVASTSAYKKGGLGFVSGSATRTSLTDGHTDGNRRGYFFRVVPNDGVQGPTVANYISKKLKSKRVFVIDDQEVYSQGLANSVENTLKGRGVSVRRDSVSQDTTDFSSLIAKIPSDTQIIYIPWQLSPRAQAFGQQLKAAGKTGPKLFGSDGLFDPSTWKIAGSYDSFFPVSPTDATVKSYAKAHGGDGQYFGAPSYVAAQVVVGAVTRACADGKATRAEVRKQIAKTKLKSSILGLPVAFQASGDLKGGKFGIYQIQKNGTYKPIG
jgi:branched-chain amino acid transport system substrate-binding protein